MGHVEPILRKVSLKEWKWLPGQDPQEISSHHKIRVIVFAVDLDTHSVPGTIPSSLYMVTQALHDTEWTPVN